MVPPLVVKKSKLKCLENSSSNTPIIDKSDKLVCQILDGKLMFVDDDDNSLIPMSNMKSDSEVKVVLLEQWRETKRDDDYDPYDDDLYESHDMSDHLQVICDDLDIMVHGRK
ncbi:hypothetical protein Tco_1383829 [Tanacetum coccineum]